LGSAPWAAPDLERLSAPGAAGIVRRVIGDMQRTAGNRAVATLIKRPPTIARSTTFRTPAAPRPAVQRDDLTAGGGGYKRGGHEQFEVSWVLKDFQKTGIKAQFKLTVSGKGSKVLESPTASGPAGSEATWSLGENKAAIERASGKWGTKVTSALARVDWSRGVIPGFPALKVRLTAKGPEGKFDIRKGEADLDLVKVSAAVDGNFIEILDWAGLAQLKDRVSLKGTFQVERGLSVRDLARLKSALMYKDEAARAAKEAEKHAIDFAKHRKSLEQLKAKRPGLKARLARNKQAVEKAAKALEKAEANPATRARALKALRTQKAAAERALVKAETALYRNRQFTRVNAYFLKRSREGLASAGKRLAAAGRKLDAALKNVTDKLAKPIKQAIEKVTARIMKKLAGTLLAKGLKYLIPGLNLAMTLYDIGSLLFTIFGGSKGGVVGGEGGDDDAEGTSGGGEGGEKGQPGEGGGGADAGQAPQSGQGGAGATKGKGGGAPGGGAPDAGVADDPAAQQGPKQPGPSAGQAPGGRQTTLTLSANAKQLLAAFRGDPMSLDDDAIKALNDAVPDGITSDELQRLIDKLAERLPKSPPDPYELAVEIQAELAAIRAGEATIEFEGGPAEPAPTEKEATAEAPKTLLPVTRTDVLNVLKYDAKANDFKLEPSFAADYKNHELSHPDGLKVKLTSFEVTSTQPSGGEGQLMIKTAIGIEVVALPPGTDASYPWKVGETREEKMTFLYDPKRQLWGEMDYSHVAQLRAVLSRAGDTWNVTGSTAVRFQFATVVVKRVVTSRIVTSADGSRVHRLALEVVPTEITSKRAGYTSSQGWIEFKVGVPVVIPFEVPEDAPAKSAPTKAAP
jgi:hypothetical protein